MKSIKSINLFNSSNTPLCLSAAAFNLSWKFGTREMSAAVVAVIEDCSSFEDIPSALNTSRIGFTNWTFIKNMNCCYTFRAVDGCGNYRYLEIKY